MFLPKIATRIQYYIDKYYAKFKADNWKTYYYVEHVILLVIPNSENILVNLHKVILAYEFLHIFYVCIFLQCYIQST